MSRGKKFLALVVSLCALWVLALGLLVRRLTPVPPGIATSGNFLNLPWNDSMFSCTFLFPFVAVALCGLSAVVSVVGQAMRFENKKEAAAELAKDLIHARADLHRRGYIFDS